MKSKFIFIAVIVFSLSVKAQIYTPAGTIQGASANNNVGIGTNAPLNGLHVFKLNDFNAGSIRFGHSNSDDAIFSFGWNTLTNSDAFKLSFSPHNSTSNILDLLTIGTNGLVGIGTANPTQKLDVNGNGIFKGGIISSISDVIGGYIKIQNPAKTSNGSASDWTIFNMTGGYGNSLQFWAYDNLACGEGGMCSNRFTIMDNGNVGIGLINPQNKLDVNGTIHSREVKVDMSGWSDFVFKKEYDLPTLEQVEKHIAEKGHLENIPSEDEVLKNGINLGEMNAKLLQKIEEMTLYMIDQNKKVEELIKENENFKIILARLSKIEEKLK